MASTRDLAGELFRIYRHIAGDGRRGDKRQLPDVDFTRETSDEDSPETETHFGEADVRRMWIAVASEHMDRPDHVVALAAAQAHCDTLVDRAKLRRWARVLKEWLETVERRGKPVDLAALGADQLRALGDAAIAEVNEVLATRCGNV